MQVVSIVQREIFAPNRAALEVSCVALSLFVKQQKLKFLKELLRSNKNQMVNGFKELLQSKIIEPLIHLVSAANNP